MQTWNSSTRSPRQPLRKLRVCSEAKRTTSATFARMQTQYMDWSLMSTPSFQKLPPGTKQRLKTSRTASERRRKARSSEVVSASSRPLESATCKRNIRIQQSVNSIYQASDFVDEFDDMKDEMQESMLLINDLMRDVMDIISKLETLDPPEGDAGTDWAAAFPDTTQLLSAAQSQMVSRTQWDVSTRGATILLDDSDMKQVSGSRQYRASVLELAEWGKRFSEKVVSFAQLILQIKDEEENLKVAALGVQHASEKADAVGQMMATSETNEDNYLSVLNQQNLVIMGLMLDFHTRARADMLAMARVLDEFCQAYRYNFFTDCTQSSRPTPADDYDAILLKLSKLQVGALDSLSSLTPPPQPFKKTFDIVESPSCNGALSSCPVSSLSSTGVATLVLSDWWGLSWTSSTASASTHFRCSCRAPQYPSTQASSLK
nr:uncharacterized protein LOC113804098 [Penaeus vannamei]